MTPHVFFTVLRIFDYIVEKVSFQLHHLCATASVGRVGGGWIETGAMDLKSGSLTLFSPFRQRSI
jgi:hypothetical protein